MKKNAMLKIAAVLLVAVLLTTCAISSTFAKYVSDGGSYTDSARVAKWGIKVDTKLDAASSSGFLKDYNGKIVTNEDDKVIAPGASGTIKLKVVISGVSEVDGKIIFIDANPNDAVNEFITCTDPALATRINWSIGGVDMNLEEVNAAIAAKEFAFESGESVSQTATLDIAWVWPYEEGEDGTDTKLGEDGDDKISLNFTAQIVQVDPNA